MNGETRLVQCEQSSDLTMPLTNRQCRLVTAVGLNGCPEIIRSDRITDQVQETHQYLKKRDEAR